MPLKREALAARRPGRRRPPGAPARPTRWCWSDGEVHADNTDVPGRGGRAARAVRRPGRAGHDPRRRRDRGLHRPGPGRARRARRSGSWSARPSGPPRPWPWSRRTRPARRCEVGSLAGDPVTGDVRRLDDPGRGPGRRRSSPAAPTCRSSSRSSTTRGRPRWRPSAVGRVLVAGLDLLVHQAALQFRDVHRAAGAAGGDARRRRGRAGRPPGRHVTDHAWRRAGRRGAVRRRRAVRAGADPRRPRARAAEPPVDEATEPDEEPKEPYADVAAAPGPRLEVRAWPPASPAA